MRAKHLLFAVVMLFAVNNVQAQLELGAKLGAGTHWILGTQLKGYERVMPHPGFYGGITASYLFDDISLQTELLFITKGHDDRSYQDGKYRRELYYLQLPVFFGWKASKRSTIMMGPEFAYLLSSKKTTDGVAEDGTDDCYRFNVGLAIQYNMMITEHIGLDIKIYAALNRTFSVPYRSIDDPTHPNVWVEHADKGHNAGITLGFCYKFQAGK